MIAREFILREVPMLGSLLVSAILALGSQARPGSASAGEPLELPGGSGGIGFDDLQFSALSGRLLVPGGRTGRLFLVDPKSRTVSSIEGFSPSKTFGGGHDEGITSVGEGDKHLYV